MIMHALLSIALMLCGFVWVARGLAADTKPAWQVTWENTVAAAKKEGRLNFYVGRYGTEPLLNEFRKEFPEIKIVTVNGAGNTLGTRIITELRAGNVLADLFSGGANTNYEILYEGKALDSIKSTLILPEVLDESKWFEGRHRYTDPESRHIFVYIANPSTSGFYFNTTLASPKDFKSYWDLVAPKWKGKYRFPRPHRNRAGRVDAILLLPSRAGAGVCQEIIWRDAADFRPRSQTNNRLAGTGTFCAVRRLPRHGAGEIQGLPVDELDMVDWKEGWHITSGGGSMSLIKGAPNPNAAKVFVNWFLSRRGQIAMQKYNDLYGEDPPNSRRIDIPKDMLPAVNRMQPGKKYFDVSDPKYADMTPMFDLIKQIMKGREAKSISPWVCPSIVSFAERKDDRRESYFIGSTLDPQ